MATIPELMRQNLLGVFNERDPQRRAAVVAETYAEEAVFHDPERTVTGRAAIAAAAQAVLDGAPGFVFAPRGRLYESGGTLGALAWRFGPEDGDPVVTGMDIALVRNGLIAEMHTVVDS
jgi:outer membrane protein assembly factor BamB